MKNDRKSYFKSIWLFALALAFLQCTGQNTGETSLEIKTNPNQNEVTLTQAQFEGSGMIWDSISSSAFTEHITATGMVNVPAEGRFDISTYFGGYIKKMELLVGQKVSKGQLLFTIENPEFIQMQQDYLDAKSQLAYLKNDFDRQKVLIDENISSMKNYLKAEADYQSTLAKSESLKKKLLLINLNPAQITPENITSRVSVLSPTFGYVETVLVNQGTYLNPSDIAVKLINKEHLHVELNVFEKDAVIIKQGQPVFFSLQGGETESIEGEVFLVGQSVNEKRMVNLHVHLKNEKEGEKLVPGMFVESKIIIASHQALSLPEESVVNVETKNFVLIKKGMENDLIYLEKREVLIGQKSGGRVEILNTSDFDANSQFLSKGAFNLILN
ncbi:efflux RND transporter periplasmic adaptor subunit [Rhodonellum sp.]|uniref:efflux RND transporter periplasmic adaptor subunit n=1 Tax=Rhodonellum sp. TaxID=2231180 RepID=UPI00271F53F5|nr:efflux RND transporter periplasmic adaptor subunit [Rhodonellum sp.]MDO9553411.1 efflux RND transporter periplasmic adaptor subunit [Rhodonellum sp.]